MMQGILEKKFVDNAQTQGCDTTGTIKAINGVAQGSDISNRIGRKYNNIAIQLRGTFIPQGITTGNLARVMLIWDAQTNGALPAMTDILTAARSDKFMNLDFRDRFKIIMDKSFGFGPYNTTATQAVSAPMAKITFYKRINLPTICDGTTSAIGDVNTGSLLLVTVGSAAAGAGHDILCTTRVRYVDG